MSCCPNCGSSQALGNETVALCSDCGQLTILGMSLPVAALATAALLVVAVVAIRWLARRARPARLAVAAA